MLPVLSLTAGCMRHSQKPQPGPLLCAATAVEMLLRLLCGRPPLLSSLFITPPLIAVTVCMHLQRVIAPYMFATQSAIGLPSPTVGPSAALSSARSSSSSAVDSGACMGAVADRTINVLCVCVWGGGSSLQQVALLYCSKYSGGPSLPVLLRLSRSPGQRERRHSTAPVLAQQQQQQQEQQQAAAVPSPG